MESKTKPRDSLHVVRTSSAHGELRIDHARARGNIGLGVAMALLGCCVIGLVVGNRQANVVPRPSPEQERAASLAKQLSSLAKTDLIVLPDSRVWYVRAVHGNSLEIVGWVGDNARSEDIDTFVIKEGPVTIVRHKDPTWPKERDRFINQ